MTLTLIGVSVALFLTSSVCAIRWMTQHDRELRSKAQLLGIVGVLVTGVALWLQATPGSSVTLPGATTRVLLLVPIVAFILALVRLRGPLELSLLFWAPVGSAITVAAWVQANSGGTLGSSTGPMGTLTWVHVSATVLGFLLFVPANVLSVLFLGQQHQLRIKASPSGLPSLLRLEKLAWQLIYLGLPLYSLGIILGFIWQERAGDAGTVQPQHIFAALGWLLYARVTFLNMKTGWRGRRAAVELMVAFALTFVAVILYGMR
jgi:ABC-type uncharacterized transport system permease subunit